MLYCFANSMGESSNSMDEKIFLKKITSYKKVTRCIGRMFPLASMEGQSKEWVNINREYFFQELQVYELMTYKFLVKG